MSKNAVQALLAALLLAAGAKAADEGCSRDIDCKGDRICVRRECVPPPALIAPGARGFNCKKLPCAFSPPPCAPRRAQGPRRRAAAATSTAGAPASGGGGGAPPPRHWTPSNRRPRPSPAAIRRRTA